MATPTLLPTTLVGSYPQPDWLIDRAKLSKQVPRVRMADLWLVPAAELEAKQDEATLLAIEEQERAGLDIISDGEQRRDKGPDPARPGHAGRREIRMDRPEKEIPEEKAKERCEIPGHGDEHGPPAGR